MQQKTTPPHVCQVTPALSTLFVHVGFFQLMPFVQHKPAGKGANEAGGRSGPCENPFTAVGCVSKSSSIRCVESGETPLDPNDPMEK